MECSFTGLIHQHNDSSYQLFIMFALCKLHTGHNNLKHYSTQKECSSISLYLKDGAKGSRSKRDNRLQPFIHLHCTYLISFQQFDSTEWNPYRLKV